MEKKNKNSQSILTAPPSTANGTITITAMTNCPPGEEATADDDGDGDGDPRVEVSAMPSVLVVNAGRVLGSKENACADVEERGRGDVSSEEGWFEGRREGEIGHGEGDVGGGEARGSVVAVAAAVTAVVLQIAVILPVSH
jgi:hypothetical protein